jgi:tetratricopeptide (TPR) repeat protein
MAAVRAVAANPRGVWDSGRGEGCGAVVVKAGSPYHGVRSAQPPSPDFSPIAPMSASRRMRRRVQSSYSFYEVVYDRMDAPGHARLPQEIRDAFPRLRDLVLHDPRAAVTELRGWIEREPLPMFYNWLSGAYSALGDIDSAEGVILENYRRNPTYLFARANYAELCLRDGDLAGAREALGDRFDIRPLLGGRKRVHVSEVTGYFYAVGLYHIKAGDRDAAEHVYRMLARVAPHELATEELRRLLHPRLRDLSFR